MLAENTLTGLVLTFIAVSGVGAQTSEDPPVPSDETVIHRAGSPSNADPRLVICTTEDQMEFLPLWQAQPEEYAASPVHLHDVERIEQLASLAVAKYPDSVLAQHLDVIYFVTELTVAGLEYGGTNAEGQLYINVEKLNSLRSDHSIECSIHHEIAHVLFALNISWFNESAWISIHPTDHRYLGSGREALEQGKESRDWNEEFGQAGFVSEYAKASLEEDFAEVAMLLFTNDQNFWTRVDQYPRIALKAYTAICFYNAIDSRFDISYFRSIKTGRLALIEDSLDEDAIDGLSRYELMNELARCSKDMRIARQYQYQASDIIETLNAEFNLLMNALKKLSPTRDEAPATEP